MVSLNHGADLPHLQEIVDWEDWRENRNRKADEKRNMPLVKMVNAGHTGSLAVIYHVSHLI